MWGMVSWRVVKEAAGKEGILQPAQRLCLSGGAGQHGREPHGFLEEERARPSAGGFLGRAPEDRGKSWMGTNGKLWQARDTACLVCGESCRLDMGVQEGPGGQGP